MVSKGFSICRSCSLAVLGLAPMAAGALALAGLMAGTASASTIYSDNFSGSATALLNGAAPTVHNGTSTTWTADSGWMQNGSVTAYVPGNVNGDDNAYLAFTPASGQIYTLTEGVDVPSGTNPYAGTGIGFLPSGFLGTPFTNSAGPSLSAGMPGSGGNGITTYAGPGSTNGNAYPAQGAGVQDLQVVLNTEAAAWTVQFIDNGVTLGSVFTYTTNPTITAVGFGTEGVNAQVSNFSLTAVPEPASLGLFAVGGLGLLLLKRRKTA